MKKLIKLLLILCFFNFLIISVNAENSLLGKIAFWKGKVNQHTENGVWKTDLDGKSGGWPSTMYSNDYGDRPLEYCKKWYSSATSVNVTHNEFISSRRDAGNSGGPYTTQADAKDVVTYSCNYVSEQSDSNLLYSQMSYFVRLLIENRHNTSIDRLNYANKILALLESAKTKISSDKKLVFDALYKATSDWALTYQSAVDLESQNPADSQTLYNYQNSPEYQVQSESKADKAVIYVNKILEIENKAKWGMDNLSEQLYSYDIGKYSDINPLWTAYNDAYWGAKFVKAELDKIECFEGDCQFIEASKNLWKTELLLLEKDMKPMLSLFQKVESELQDESELSLRSLNRLSNGTYFNTDEIVSITNIQNSMNEKGGWMYGEGVKMQEFVDRYGLNITNSYSNSY